MMDGRTFTYRAIRRRVCYFTTTTTERFPKSPRKPESHSMATDTNRQEWARTRWTTTGTAGWTSSRQIFPTIPRRSITTTATELLATQQTKQDSEETHSISAGERYSWTLTTTGGPTFSSRTGTSTRK